MVNVVDATPLKEITLPHTVARNYQLFNFILPYIIFATQATHPMGELTTPLLWEMDKEETWLLMTYYPHGTLRLSKLIREAAFCCRQQFTLRLTDCSRCKEHKASSELSALDGIFTAHQVLAKLRVIMEVEDREERLVLLCMVKQRLHA